MSATPSSSLLRRFTRARRRARALEPADHGTAFGLEMSMQAGVPAEPDDTEPLRRLRQPWWRRMLRR